MQPKSTNPDSTKFFQSMDYKTFLFSLYLGDTLEHFPKRFDEL